MKTKVAVACRNASGVPDMVLLEVEASQEAIATGEHYELAQDMAQDRRYEGPYVCFDPSEFGAITSMADEIRRLT